MMDTKELKDYTEFTVSETAGFRLRVRKWKCKSPSDLNSVEFIQECLTDGKVVLDSTYNFFLSDKDIEKLCTQLQS